jgi:glycosyltransferase involved in cell wall biosynthesis
LKIAVNTRLLLKNKLEGIGWFTFESLKRIVLKHPEHDFFFIFDRKYSEDFIFADNVKPVVIGPQARHPILQYIWFEISIPRALNKIKPDLFISPDAYLSLSSKYPDLIVIHDLNFEHYPELMPFIARKYYKYFTPKFARKARRIATVSEFSKEDIAKQYGIGLEKIDVVYNGSNEKFKPVDSVEKDAVKSKLTDGKDYFVFVGALNPRKNLANIFIAFDKFKSVDSSDIRFVVVGEKMYWSSDIKNAYENLKHKDDIIFTGRLESEDLSKVVGSAIGLIYASYFEGFGIPIIEAFNADVPVITSNVTSMPEIAGDAAILVNPESTDQIMDAMHQISTNEELVKGLIEKARSRRKFFSWERTSDNLWDSVLKTIDKNQN